jgi:hypothetical protein
VVFDQRRKWPLLVKASVNAACICLPDLLFGRVRALVADGRFTKQVMLTVRDRFATYWAGLPSTDAI